MAQLAVTLKDLILQTASEPVIRPPSSVQTRRAACTHMTMSKLYGPYRCTHCNQIPRLGWVYRCTQDRWMKVSSKRNSGTDSQASTTDDIGENDNATNVLQLSPWMEEAILKGHYTLEESIILREQKQEVKNSIAAAQRNLNQQHRASYPQISPRPSVNTDQNIPFPIIEESPEELMLLPQLPPIIKPPMKQNLILECIYKTCSTCRPLSRDRAWQSFDHIFKNVSTPIYIDFSTDNRPISDVDLVRQLGLPNKPRSRYQTFSDIDLILNNENQRLPPRDKDTPSSPIDIDTGRGRSKKAPSQLYYDNSRNSQGFRESARHAFYNIFSGRHRRRSRASNASSRSSRKARREQEDWEDSDLSLQRGLEPSPEFLLFQATTTRLPGLDGMDGLETEKAEEAAVTGGVVEEREGEGGEVLVPDGVAVTEEAVDLGSADIIMAV